MNIIMRYTVVSCIVITVWVLLEHLFALNTAALKVGQTTRFIGGCLIYVFIFIAIMKLRRLEGNFTILSGIRVGSCITLAYSLYATGFYFFYTKYINPEFYSLVKNYEIERLQSKGLSSAENTQAIRKLELIYSGELNSYMAFLLFSLLAGMIVSVIISVVLKLIFQTSKTRSERSIISV